MVLNFKKPPANSWSPVNNLSIWTAWNLLKIPRNTTGSAGAGGSALLCAGLCFWVGIRLIQVDPCTKEIMACWFLLNFRCLGGVYFGEGRLTSHVDVWDLDVLYIFESMRMDRNNEQKLRKRWFTRGSGCNMGAVTSTVYWSIEKAGEFFKISTTMLSNLLYSIEMMIPCKHWQANLCIYLCTFFNLMLLMYIQHDVHHRIFHWKLTPPPNLMDLWMLLMRLDWKSPQTNAVLSRFLLVPSSWEMITLPPSSHVLMVPWKMGSDGRCGRCLQMGYFPRNHDYGRKGKPTHLVMFFLKTASITKNKVNGESKDI